jgi:hypothetical protein
LKAFVHELDIESLEGHDLVVLMSMVADQQRQVVALGQLN